MTFLVRDLVGVVDVGGKAHERYDDDADTGAGGLTQIGLIFFGQSQQGDGNARQANTLVGGYRTGRNDLDVYVVALNLGDPKANLAVIN